MKRGFFCFATDNADTNYTKLAQVALYSAKFHAGKDFETCLAIPKGQSHPTRYVATNGLHVERPDHVIEFDPFSENPFSAESLAASLSPFDVTLKIEADMFFGCDTSTWFERFVEMPYDFLPAYKAMTYRNEPILDTKTRHNFRMSKIPLVYSACTIFKKSTVTQEVFKTMKTLFENESDALRSFLHADGRPRILDTDFAYALALKLTSCDGYDFEHNYAFAEEMNFPSFVHMKSDVQRIHMQFSGEWMQILDSIITEDLHLYVGSHKMHLPFHYHYKNWLQTVGLF